MNAIQTSPAPPPIYIALPPQRPWLSWAFALLMAVVAAYAGKPLPALPPLPFTLPIPPQEPPPPPAKPKPKAEPTAAIARIQFGNSGCTASAIEPRRADGRYDILTAAHCVENAANGILILKDGRRIGVTVKAKDREADWCWLLTDTTNEELPTLTLAKSSPEKDTSVWHAGYGIDRPSNREEGTATGSRTVSGQQEFVLSVSSGDSGGPVMRCDNDEVVSAVCCTQARGQRVPMYGSETERIRAGRPAAVLLEEWQPIEIRECKQQKAK